MYSVFKLTKKIIIKLNIKSCCQKKKNFAEIKNLLDVQKYNFKAVVHQVSQLIKCIQLLL